MDIYDMYSHQVGQSTETPLFDRFQEQSDLALSGISALLEDLRMVLYHRELEWQADRIRSAAARLEETGRQMIQLAEANRLNLRTNPPVVLQGVPHDVIDKHLSGDVLSVVSLVKQGIQYCEEASRIISKLTERQDSGLDRSLGDLVVIEITPTSREALSGSEDSRHALDRILGIQDSNCEHWQHAPRFDIPELEEIDDPLFTISMYQAAIRRAEELEDGFIAAERQYEEKRQDFRDWYFEELGLEKASGPIRISGSRVEQVVAQLAEVEPNLTMHDALERCREKITNEIYQERSSKIKEGAQELNQILGKMNEIVQDKNNLFRYSEDGPEDTQEDREEGKEQ